jgi:hypothetical protein
MAKYRHFALAALIGVLTLAMVLSSGSAASAAALTAANAATIGEACSSNSEDTAVKPLLKPLCVAEQFRAKLSST